MSRIQEMPWHNVFESTWRILVFLVAIAMIVIVSNNWTRWEVGEGSQRNERCLPPVGSRAQPEQYLRSQPRQYGALFELNSSAET